MASEPKRRFVLDLNALISAFLFPESAPGRALELVLTEHELLMSLELAAEAIEVFRRPKFDRYLSRERREELMIGTIHASVFVQTTEAIDACRDVDDNRVLELASAGRAAAIVTGDVDLLARGSFRAVDILTPRDFLVAQGR
jgi:uncharacterized protein